MTENQEVTFEEMAEMLKRYRKLSDEGYTEEEINKILGLDPTKSPIL